MPTTANLDLSLISDALLTSYDRVHAAGRQFPKGLRVHADNATSETKNQVAFKMGAFLLHLDLFEVIAWTYFQTGHSHGLPDQRFSEVRHLLFQESTLQTPADFVRVLGKVKPRQQRELTIKTPKCMEDWTMFLQPLEIILKGHVTTHKMKQNRKHASHYFLMTRREKYAEFGDVSMIENFDGEPAHPKDIILVLKSHLSSDDLSQPPFVVVPFSSLEKMHGFPEYTVALKPMAKETKKEMKKTIEKIIKPPWCMTDAAGYLNQLIAQEGTVPVAPGEDHPLQELCRKLHGEDGAPAMKDQFKAWSLIQ